MSTPLRILGRDGPRVSSVGLGFGSISGFYGPAGTIDERVALLDHAHKIGLRFWDLADVYLDAEDLVGEWIKRSDKRNGYSSPRNLVSNVSLMGRIPSAQIQIDAIDLYYCHRVDGVTPVEKTIEAMVKLKNEGKIRYLGLSGVSADTLRRAHVVHPITALQMEYSLFNLDIESGILETCRELGITIVAYCPIGRGILTGQFKSLADIPENDHRRTPPKFSEDNFPKLMEIVRKLEKIAAVREVTPAQVALAWLLAQGPDIIPIPGTKSTDKMDENLASSLLTLSDDELQDIRYLVERTEIQGTQYSAAVMASLQGNTPSLQESSKEQS
ncbi:hypothetical protein N7488_007128 [Penicillium malachiteum]|nr:hypothetical protein N7488_007128 [Penicillium malachiteum]